MISNQHVINTVKDMVHVNPDLIYLMDWCFMLQSILKAYIWQLHIDVQAVAVLSKYSGVLSYIGLTDFEILSDRTKFCQTELFFHKAYNFGHIMIVGLNICMFFVQRQMDKVIQCYLLFKCRLSHCGASKSKAWQRDGWTDWRWTKWSLL